MKKSIISFTVLTVFLAFASGAAQAINVHELNGTDLGMGAGARAIGMGGAFIALGDDASAVFWNPAAMTKVSKTQETIMLDTNPSRYSFKSIVIRPKAWRKSKGDFALGIARTNRLKYIADGDWAQGNASHLIDLSMINVERNYVGGLNSRTTDLRVSFAGRIPGAEKLAVGATYIDFNCVTTFYLQGTGRVCQTVAYKTMDFGLLYDMDAKKRFGLTLRNPIEPSKPKYLILGSAFFKGKDTFTLDIERIFGEYGNDRRKCNFLMLRGGWERKLNDGWRTRAGIIIPLRARTSTLGDIRSKLPSPKFGGAAGVGYTFRSYTLDLALYGDPGKSYVKSKAVISGVLSLSHGF
ncbi:MAG TPA: hypothetical protein PLQ76_07535 [bacterium]|nr:hypothetical protein [bacterium]